MFKFKYLAIIVAIAMPVIFYVFFKSTVGQEKRPRAPRPMFATSTYDTINAKGKKIVDTLYETIPNQKFATQLGDSLSLDSLRGNIYVANFFFATCPGICPVMNKQLTRIQREFIKDKNFKIISISVDPTRDSIPVLKEYAEHFDAIPGKWYFCRGNKDSVYQLAKTAFHVTAKDDDGSPDHSEKLVLVDARGHVRGYYSGIDSTRVKKMMGDIVLCLKEIELSFSFRK